MRNDFLIDKKSAYLVADEVALNRANRTWVYQASSVDSEADFTARKVDADIAETRKLLDGAIALAWHTVKSNRRAPALTSTRWVWRLAGAYHLCHPTERLMKKAAERFTLEGRWSLARWAAQKAKEEAGHDRIALLDIQSMGYNAEAVVKALVPPAAKTLVDYFTQSVEAPDPISCVGYCYTNERLAICRGKEHIEAVKSLLPYGTDATRFLRSHSRACAEVEHVEQTVEMIAGLNLQERIYIANACYETALLCFTTPEENYISDEELQSVLKPMEHI